MSGKVSSNPHIFRVKDKGFAYDPATGSLHLLDDVGYRVLEYLNSCAGASLDDTVRALTGEFEPRQVAEAWEEARTLKGSVLWVDEKPLPRTDIMPDVPIKAVCLDVAHDCNLGCRYCFASGGSFGGKRERMTPETAIKAVDFVTAASGTRRYIDIDFFGGEPLLAFDAVKAAVHRARNLETTTGKAFRFTLTTNCTLVTDEIIEFLNKEHISLILSIDGRPEVHDFMRPYLDGRGSYHKVLNNARKIVASRKGTDYFIRGTYTRHNLDFANDVKHLYELGFRRISLEPVVGDMEWGIRFEDLGKIKESYEELTEFWIRCRELGDEFVFYHFDLGLSKGLCRERRETGCGAGYEYVAVTPSGKVYPCHQLVGSDQFCLGEVGGSFGKKHLSQEFYSARVPNKPKCIECWARYLCGGGCHARALAANGTLTEPDPLACQIMKMRLEFALYVEYLKHR